MAFIGMEQIGKLKIVQSKGTKCEYGCLILKNEMVYKRTSGTKHRKAKVFCRKHGEKVIAHGWYVLK